MYIYSEKLQKNSLKTANDKAETEIVGKIHNCIGFFQRANLFEYWSRSSTKIYKTKIVK